jgi:hypothetical protein
MHITAFDLGARGASGSLRPGKAASGFRSSLLGLLIVAGTALPGLAQTAVSSFDNITGPTFVAIDPNRAIGGTTATWLYVSEHGNTNNTGGGRILRYNLAAPSTAPTDIGGGHFVSPDGILVDKTTGDLIIADRAQDKITRIGNDGSIKWSFGSGTAGAADEMHGPCALATDSTGAIYVSEHGETLSSPPGSGGSFVSKYTVTSSGQAQRQFRIGGVGTGNSQFANTGPYGVAVIGNQLFVSDGFNARVEVFGLDGTFVSQFATPNALPLGLFADASGSLWIAESSGQGDGPIERVEQVSTAGVASGVDLTTTNPSLSLPFDTAIDAATNRAYVADYTNHRVVVFDLSASSSGGSSGGTSSGGTSTGGSSSGGTSTGGTSTGGSTTGGSSSGGTSTGGSSTGGGGTTSGGNATIAVSSVTVPADGSYRAGDALVFTVHFSAPIKVVTTGENDDEDDDKGDKAPGSASIAWKAVSTSGSADVDSGAAVLVGPIGSTDLTFKYQVHGNDRAPNGIQVDTTIVLGAGTRITDAAGHVLSADQLKFTLAQNPLTGVVLVPANESNPGKGSEGKSASGGVGVIVGKKSARLINLSSRVRLKRGDANHTIAVGFVVSGTGTQTVLVRAVGPGLRAFGVTDAASDPSVTVRSSSGTVLGVNGGWNNAAALIAAAQQVGAFPLASGSRDAALVLQLQPGAYTATVTSDKSDGEVLLEIYDTTNATTPTAQLVNLSTRGFVDAGGNLIAGFVVQGTDPKQVLVRAIGPGLSTFGVGGVLADPMLEVHDATGAVVARNNDWDMPQPIDASHPASTAAEITAADTTVGAFPLAAGSKDGAVLMTLNPGTYSAVVTGAGSSSGAALVEVYQLP